MRYWIAQDTEENRRMQIETTSAAAAQIIECVNILWRCGFHDEWSTLALSAALCTVANHESCRTLVSSLLSLSR